MTTHSSIFAWRIPWTEEPGGLRSTGSQRAGHDRLTNTFSFQNLTFNVGMEKWWKLGDWREPERRYMPLPHCTVPELTRCSPGRWKRGAAQGCEQRFALVIM